MYYEVSKCDDMTRPVQKHPHDQQIKNCRNSSVYPIQPVTQQSEIFGNKGATGLLKGDVGKAFYYRGKAIPLQAWTGPEGSRSLRLPDFKTFGT
jgi:hypothetical protein